MGDMNSYFRRLENDQPPMEAHTTVGHTTVSDGSPNIGPGYGGGTCCDCGAWVPAGLTHSCPTQTDPFACPTYWSYYPTENKTEKAYNVLKKLVEKKIVPEPKSYKAFCELVEGIAGVL